MSNQPIRGQQSQKVAAVVNFAPTKQTTLRTIIPKPSMDHSYVSFSLFFLPSPGHMEKPFPSLPSLSLSHREILFKTIKDRKENAYHTFLFSQHNFFNMALKIIIIIFWINHYYILRAKTEGCIAFIKIKKTKKMTLKRLTLSTYMIVIFE